MANWLGDFLKGKQYKNEPTKETTREDVVRKTAAENPFVKSAMADEKKDSMERRASVVALIDPDRRKHIAGLSDVNLAWMLTELTLQDEGKSVQLGHVERYPEMHELVVKDRKGAEDKLFKLLPKHTMSKKAALTDIWTVSEVDGKESIVRLFELIPRPADVKEFCKTLLSGTKTLTVGDVVKNSSFDAVPVGEEGKVVRIDPKAGKAFSVYCEFPKGSYWVSPEQIEKKAEEKPLTGVPADSVCECGHGPEKHNEGGCLASGCPCRGGRYQSQKKSSFKSEAELASAASVNTEAYKSSPDEAHYCKDCGSVLDENGKCSNPRCEWYHLKSELKPLGKKRSEMSEQEKTFCAPSQKTDDMKHQVPAPYRTPDQDYTPNTKDFGEVYHQDKLAPETVATLNAEAEGWKDLALGIGLAVTPTLAPDSAEAKPWDYEATKSQTTQPYAGAVDFLKDPAAYKATKVDFSLHDMLNAIKSPDVFINVAVGTDGTSRVVTTDGYLASLSTGKTVKEAEQGAINNIRSSVRTPDHQLNIQFLGTQEQQDGSFLSVFYLSPGVQISETEKGGYDTTKRSSKLRSAAYKSQVHGPQPHEEDSDSCHCDECLKGSWADLDQRRDWLGDLNGMQIGDQVIDMDDTIIGIVSQVPFEDLPEELKDAMRNHFPGTPSSPSGSFRKADKFQVHYVDPSGQHKTDVVDASDVKDADVQTREKTDSTQVLEVERLGGLSKFDKTESQPSHKKKAMETVQYVEEGTNIARKPEELGMDPTKPDHPDEATFQGKKYKRQRILTAGQSYEDYSSSLDLPITKWLDEAISKKYGHLEDAINKFFPSIESELGKRPTTTEEEKNWAMRLAQNIVKDMGDQGIPNMVDELAEYINNSYHLSKWANFVVGFFKKADQNFLETLREFAKSKYNKAVEELTWEEYHELRDAIRGGPVTASKKTAHCGSCDEDVEKIAKLLGIEPEVVGGGGLGILLYGNDLLIHFGYANGPLGYSVATLVGDTYEPIEDVGDDMPGEEPASIEQQADWIRQVAQRFNVDLAKQPVHKKADKEQIPGGLSEGMTEEELANKNKVEVEQIKKQIEDGQKVEMHEHAPDNPALAKEIATDHISEPGGDKYYPALKQMENVLDKYDESKGEKKQEDGSH